MASPSIKVLETFYHETLPLFTPQAERVLDTAPPDSLNEMAFRYTFSVPAMIKISRIIEKSILDNYQAADLHVSFQHLSRLINQKPMYSQLAISAHHLWLYYETDTDPAPVVEIIDAPTTTIIDTANTPLVDYWFVIAYGGGVKMSLLAREIPALSGSDRYYEGFYTFDAQIAYQLVNILHQIYPIIPVPEKPSLTI